MSGFAIAASTGSETATGPGINSRLFGIWIGLDSTRLPTHQFLGGLLVLLEKLAVVLALNDLWVERQRPGLSFVLLRGDGLFQIPNQGDLDILWQACGRGDATRHRPHLVEALLAKGWPVGDERRTFSRHHSEDTELAGLDVLGDLAHVAGKHFDIAGEHLGLAFRRAAEMDHLETRSGVGTNAECGDVIVGAVAAAVERNRPGAAFGLVDDVLDGFEVTVGSHCPKIRIDDMVD